MPRQTKTNIYCGIKQTAPKGKKLGNMEECAKIGQLRRWGIKKVPKEFMFIIKELAKRKRITKEEEKEFKKLLKPKNKTKVYKPKKEKIERVKLPRVKYYESQGKMARSVPPMFRLTLPKQEIMLPEYIPLPLSPRKKSTNSKVVKKELEYNTLFNHPNAELLTVYFKNQTALKSALKGKTNKIQILKGLITTLNRAKTTKAIENFMDKHQLSN